MTNTIQLNPTLAHFKGLVKIMLFTEVFIFASIKMIVKIHFKNQNLYALLTRLCYKLVLYSGVSLYKTATIYNTSKQTHVCAWVIQISGNLLSLKITISLWSRITRNTY